MDAIELSSIKITEGDGDAPQQPARKDPVDVSSQEVGDKGIIEPLDQTIVRSDIAETYPPQGGYPRGEFPPDQVISEQARKGKEKKKEDKECWCCDTLEFCDCDCDGCDCGDCDCGDCDCGDCDCDD